MKVYVCYFDWDYDGCSMPEKVFTKLEDAEKYCRLEKADYVILELE